MSDDGYYMVTIKNEAGSISKEFTVTVKAKKKDIPMPEFEDEPKPITVEEEETILITFKLKEG